MNTVGKWLGEHVGAIALPLAFVSLAALLIAVVPPPRTRAESTPGEQWDDVCECRVTLLEGREWIDAVTSPTSLNAVNIPFWDANSTAKRAIIGFFSESTAAAQSIPFSSLSVSFNGAAAGTFTATNGLTTASLDLPGDNRSFRQTIDITDLVNQRGAGAYRITNGMQQGAQGNAVWPFSFAYIIEENSGSTGLPMTQISVNDFFYAAGTVPSTTVVNLGLEGVIPAGYHYFGGGSFHFFGGSWNNSSPNGGDASSATYVMGNVAGVVPFSNTNPQSVWPLNGWGNLFIPDLDPYAVQLTVTIRNTSLPESVRPGVGESGSMLIFQAQLETNAPTVPEIQTDTCYDDED
jgi:hypothetical protein